MAPWTRARWMAAPWTTARWMAPGTRARRTGPWTRARCTVLRSDERSPSAGGRRTRGGTSVTGSFRGAFSHAAVREEALAGDQAVPLDQRANSGGHDLEWA